MFMITAKKMVLYKEKIFKLFDDFIIKYIALFLTKIGVYCGPEEMQSDDWERFESVQVAFSYYVFSVCLLLLAIIWLFCSGWIDISGDFCDESFFQRAGAVLVASALYVEYKRIGPDHKDHCGNPIVLGDIKGSLHILDTVFIMFGRAAALLGTFIWAYGDLIISSAPCCNV